MPRCTRKGCAKEFKDNANETCTHHSGSPVFHEGLKSWSCCADVNKPVLEFDEFMAISGCTTTTGHTSETPKEIIKTSSSSVFTVSNTPQGAEAYTPIKQQAMPAPAPTPITVPVVEEEEDLEYVINPGTTCRRNGCKAEFVSDEISRLGDGEGTICKYHPSLPIFREGSKGYLCCKRRVLEFDEFLKITGCRTGRHLFSPPAVKQVTEEIVDCRVDHYQTVDKIHVSVYAKKTDEECSSVQFKENQVTIDLRLPGSKRFIRTLELFGPIDPEKSTLQFFGTKVEIHLQKRDNRSWTLLEKTTHNIGNISLTFGVGGRTGTIGARDVILDESNKARA